MRVVKCEKVGFADFVRRGHWQGGRWQRHAMELMARGGMHGSERRETGMVGEEVACAAWSRLARRQPEVSKRAHGERLRSSVSHSLVAPHDGD